MGTHGLSSCPPTPFIRGWTHCVAEWGLDFECGPSVRHGASTQRRDFYAILTRSSETFTRFLRSRARLLRDSREVERDNYVILT
jgi:hypothetical protein